MGNGESKVEGNVSGEEEWISLGPWGENVGKRWAYKADGPLLEITLCFDHFIRSIVLASKSCDGVVISSSGEVYPSETDPETKTFCIDGSKEQLSSISLKYGPYGDRQSVISFLCLETNIGNRYGPFGGTAGASLVSIPVKGGVLAGFHGCTDGPFLTAIGVFLAPKVKSLPSSKQKVDSLHPIQDPDSVPTQPKGKISDEEGWIYLGPWGGEDGVDWAYQASGPVVQISICYGEAIHSILFRSRSFDGLVIESSEKIGGSGGYTTKTFCIDNSVEQLLNIGLTYEDFDGQVAIKSICFCTNLSKYGPFGLRSGASSVSIPIQGGVLVGFHGRGGTNLSAIGVIVAPKINNLPSLGKTFDGLQLKDPDCAPTQLKGKIGSEEGWMTLGPWGEKDGVDWAYKFNGPIMVMRIVYGKAIDSITCESKSYNGVVIGSSERIGSNNGILVEKISINTSSEQLMSMSFTYGEHSIQSLSIYTNLRKCGPYGSGTGASFVSIPLEGGVFGGFHGKTDGCDNITAFGVFVAPKFNSLHSIQDPDFVPKQPKSKISGGGGCISLGPFGVERDDNWVYIPDGPVLEISTYANGYISGILFKSKTCDGVVKGSSGEIGICGGSGSKTFCIDSSVEQLSSIRVTGGDHNGSRVITSLSFETNIGNKYEHFGLEKGALSASFPVEGGIITGFHGYASSILLAIGIFVAPKVNRLPSSEENVDTLLPSQDPDSTTPTQLKGNISEEEGRISLGPWGGEDGVKWDYKPNGPILQISICYGEVIDSIVFRSRSFNGLVIGSSERIGGTGGRTTKTFCIDDSIEQLVNISLTYEDYDGQVAIKSLCFYTNRNTYGPFGTASIYSSMSIRIGGGVIVEFYGRGRTYLTAIGIVVAPNVNNLPGLEEKFNRLPSVQELDYVPTQLKGKISNEEGWMSLGPWGGEYGADWSYIVDGPIMQLSIGYGRAINSVLWESKSYDDMVIGSSGTIGSPYGHLTQTFCIDTSVEQLKSISLTYGDYCIDSLCFDTNLNKYGPFGWGKGASSKCIPVEDGVLVGFHGRTDGSYITAIGIIVANKFNSLHSTQNPDSVQNQLKGNSRNEEGWMPLGPWGGKDGEDWSYEVKGPIMHISIGYGKAINSISCTSKSYDGLVIGCPQKFGSTNGHVTEMFCFDTLEEQLTSISLKYDYFRGKVTITTLCFNTNLNKYGPFGSGTGASSESIPIEGGVLRGFHGRTDGRYITAIGIFLAFEVNSLHSVQDPDSAPIHPKALGSGVGSKPIESKWSSRFLAPKFKAKFCGFKPKTLENIVVPYTASNSATTDKDGQHRGAPSPSSEMIRKDLHLVDSAFQKYIIHMDILNNLDLVNSEFEKHGIYMYMRVSEAREKLKGLQRYGRKESEKFEQLQETGKYMDIQINLASEKFEEEQKLWSRGRDFDALGNIIAKLKFQIRLATKSDDHNDGALSPISTMIHRNLILLDTASAEAEESTYHMNVKINQAYEKFKELQRLASSESYSGKQQKIDSDKKELLGAIIKLKVQICSHNKVRSANTNPHKRNWDDWDNINGAENGMTHFFHEEPEDAHNADDGILKAFHDLPKPLHDCLFCFFKFPPMAVIKRTPMIYLWIGQGYISEYLHSEGYIWDVEVHAGKIFDELTAKGFIEPINQNFSLLPDSCRMSLFVRSSLYKEAKRAGFPSHGTLDLDPASVRSDPIRGSSCLINVGAAIVNFQSELFESMEHIQSLYLGRWQSSATHHIELATTKILRNLNKLKRLTFLSLRGISMIIELPKCISNLNDLMILDLRACHNLEVIPENIGLLKNLTHLDMSECYHLKNMPKSLAQLSNLQVLKGFLIGDFNSKQSCTVRNLAGLQKLRKLNIHISVKDWLQDLKHLERFEGLKRLTISWGLQSRAEVITEAFRSATFPPRLQKLDLQCFPMASLTNWLMAGKLKELKKLYIRGGQLRHLGEIEECQVEQWSVEILRLKYLSELELNWRELTTKFPKLIFLHQVDCPKFINFPCDRRGVWINKMVINTHTQLQKFNGTSGMISSSSTLGPHSTSA